MCIDFGFFADHSEPFAIKLAEGPYQSNVWVDTKTSTKTPVNPILIQTDDVAPVSFIPPLRDTDWVLILRLNEVIGK